MTTPNNVPGAASIAGANPTKNPASGMTPLPGGWRAVRSWLRAIAGVLLIAAFLSLLEAARASFDSYGQIYVGWGCFAAILLMYRIKMFRRQPWRLVFMLLAGFLALRYMQWRTMDSLVYTGPLDFIGMALLYLAEVYGLIIYLLGMFVNFSPLDSKHIPLPVDVEQLPTVDIFIPTYNEPEDIIRITVTAASQINYPRHKLHIYILDDGGTQAKRAHPETGIAAWQRHYRLRQMASDLGLGYITRETNQQAKAGNINHALQYSSGELLLILDCDHVPTKDILQNTVGHFVADPKLFLVQTPHFFINPTPVDRNPDGVPSLPGENDMFYRRIHPALNFWNASYFCGSAALLRRAHLLEVGGIRGDTITEDAETSFQLHSRGYNSVYVNKPMVCGLSPESYDDYVTQRSRWAQGMVQLVLLYSPLKAKGLSLAQKLAYFNSSFFWMFGFPRFIYFIAPASYLVLGLNVYHASWMQIAAYTLPYVFSIYLVMDFFYAGTRQVFFSEIYESVQSLFLIPAVFAVLLNPWKPSFKVTPKGVTNEKSYLNPLAAPFFLVIGINVLAVLLAAVQWVAEPAMRDLVMVTAVWTFYNLYLALVSLGAFWEHKQVRKFYRIHDRGQVTAYFPKSGTSHRGAVHDVSMTGIGFSVQLPFFPHPQEEVVLEVKDSYGRSYRFNNRIHRAVMHQGKYLCGSEFTDDPAVYADAVSYVFGDSQRWQDDWNRKSQSHGAYRMIWHYFRAGSHAFLDAIRPLFVVGERHWIADRWFSVPALRDKALAAASWCVYCMGFAGALLVELLDHRQVRKVERISAARNATVHIPRLNATLMGELTDHSLTGMAVLVEIPFELRVGERVMVRAPGKDGKTHRFECRLLRVANAGGKSLCGMELAPDLYAYPRIVKFVYGGSRRMLRAMLLPGSGVAAQGRGAALKAAMVWLNALVRGLRGLARILAVLFLNPSSRRAGFPRNLAASPDVRAVQAPGPDAHAHVLALQLDQQPLQFRARRVWQPLKVVLARRFFPMD